MSINFVKPIITINGTGNENKTFKFYEKGFEINSKIQEPTWQDVTISGQMSLTLLNAKANSLSYLKAFGKCEQRNLPSAYQQVEWLQSDGACYIDTGRVPNMTDIIEQKFKKVGTDTSTSAWYGSMPSSSVVLPRFGMGTYGRQDLFFGANATVSFLRNVDANDHTIRWQCTNLREGHYEYTLDGVQYSTTTMGNSFDSVSLTSYLFARHGTDGVQTYDGEGTRIYYHKEYLSDETIQLDLVPCRRASDGTLGMYDLVAEIFHPGYGSGTLTAGAEVVPTPDNPMDIICNNGVLKFGKSITIDSTRIFAYINPDGFWISSSDSYSVAIPVVTGKKYIISFTNTDSDTVGTIFRYGFSDTNSPTGQTLTQWVRTTPQDTPSVELTAVKSYLIIQMGANVAGGNISNGYITLKEATIYIDGTQETIKVNYFDKNTMVVEGKFVRAGGVSTDRPLGSETINDQWNCSTYIKVEPNTEYTTVVPFYQEASAAGLVFFSSNTVESAISGISTSGQASTTYTFTTPNNCKYIRFSWNNSRGNDVYLIKTGNTATAENLLSVGNYKDVQSVIDGSVTRNVGIKILNGSEDWRATSTYTNKFYLTNNFQYLKTGTTIGYCTHFGFQTPLPNTGDLRYNNAAFYYGAGANIHELYLAIQSDTTMSANDLKQWLASQYANGTPVIVVYPLATPTTETVTGQPMTIQAGTNIIQVTQSSINGLELEAQYKAGVGVTVTQIEDVNLDNSVTVTIS